MGTRNYAYDGGSGLPTTGHFRDIILDTLAQQMRPVFRPLAATNSTQQEPHAAAMRTLTTITVATRYVIVH